MNALIVHSDTCAVYRCDQGHIFDVDPHTEEGLYFHPFLLCLYGECPTCGERQQPPLRDWFRRGFWGRLRFWLWAWRAR